MTENKTITVENALFALALCLALAVRLIGLSALPFNETEANWAWQAYQVSQGQAVQIGSQPAYVLLTGLVFFLFTSSEALARMLPAILGAMVVALPYALRDRIGHKAALVAAFGLALDPIMVAVSRQTGGVMLAVGFASLGLWAWLNGKRTFAGIFTALFLLCGQPAIALLLAVGLVWLILRISGDYSSWETPEGVKSFLAAAGLTLFVVGTLWMNVPEGLSAMLQAVPEYLAGWYTSQGTVNYVPGVQLLAALPIYQPIGLILAVVALFRQNIWRQKTSRTVALLGLALFVLAVAYPSRKVSDLVWVLPMVWLLAGCTLAPLLQRSQKDERLIVWGEAVAIIAMLAWWWSNLLRITQNTYINFPENFKLSNIPLLDPPTQDYLVRMTVVVVLPLIIVMLVVIVTTVWSWHIGLQGTLRGLGLMAIFYTIMVLLGFGDIRSRQANELWNPPTAPGYADDLRAALGELSEPYTGNRNDIEVVYQLDLALLHWELRDMPNARYAPVLNAGETPAVIINDLDSLEELNGSGVYRGEKIALQLERSWDGKAFPENFKRWLIYREGPVEKQWVVLWARDDIFIGYEPEGSGSGDGSGTPGE